MDRRDFLLSLSLLLVPTIVKANPFAGWFVRGILRSAFRSLTRRSFSRYSFRAVSHSIGRTSSRISLPNRITSTFGRQRHTITNKAGKVVGSAQVEGNALIFRDVQKRILGYMQTEKNALAVYGGDGTRAVIFRRKANRIIAYNENEDYLGQIIEKTIKDEIKSVFVDSLGNEHDSIPIELQAKNEEVTKITKANTAINNGRLEVFNKDNILVLYGVEENEDLVLYNTSDELKARIKKHDGRLFVYGNSGELLQTVLEGQVGSIKFDF